VEDYYSIARDCPKREIRKLARYVDSEELVAYAFIVVGEIVIRKFNTSENHADMLIKSSP